MQYSNTTAEGWSKTEEKNLAENAQIITIYKRKVIFELSRDLASIKCWRNSYKEDGNDPDRQGCLSGNVASEVEEVRERNDVCSQTAQEKCIEHQMSHSAKFIGLTKKVRHRRLQCSVAFWNANKDGEYSEVFA